MSNMNRRDLIRGLAAFPAACAMAGMPIKASSRRKKIKKPKRLKSGDTIGIIAPASGVSDETLEESLLNFQDLGFKTKVGKFARSRNGFLAGKDSERLRDLHWAFQDSEVKAVWCIRGGYGTSRLLPKINYDLIKRHPKIFVGFSDITALHIALYQKTGLVTFHGPNGASTFTDYTKRHLINILTKPRRKYEIGLPEVPEGEDPELYKATVINGGRANGRLTGGNLSLLSVLAGTPYGLENVKGKILFIEDVNEQPYRIDRMLTQLRQSLNMRSLAGIAVGVFTRGAPDQPSQTMTEVIRERLGGLGIPVIFGLSFGHIRDKFTIPLGIKAELDTARSTLTFLESSVK